MRSVYITSTTINIISIRVIDAVVNIFTGVFVIVYLCIYILLRLFVYCVVVYIQDFYLL